MTRTNFWDLIATDSEKENQMEDLFMKKTRQEIAEHLNTHPTSVSSFKSGARGMPPEVARKAAFGTSSKAGNLYLISAVNALLNKINRGAIKDENVLVSAQKTMASFKSQFRDSEIDRRDPEFIAAATRLKEIAVACLETFGPGEHSEPVNDVNSGVTNVAAKSVQRDVHGRAVPQGDKIERDPMGRRIR